MGAKARIVRTAITVSILTRAFARVQRVKAGYGKRGDWRVSILTRAFARVQRSGSA